MKKTVYLVIVAILMFSGCSTQPRQEQRPDNAKNAIVECKPVQPQSVRYYLKSGDSDEKHETLRLEATGYGAPPKEYYPEYQRRLMAMRASKIDAYRALAETVNGIHIWGGTTLGDMAVKSDNYRVFLNSYVRGAREVSVTERQDGNYETVLSVEVNQDFFTYMLANRLTYNPECNTGPGRGVSTVMSSDKMAPSSFYYSE